MDMRGRRLSGAVDLTGKQHKSAAFLFVWMCLLWFVFYPAAFFRRKQVQSS
jgi:hypothetical protein